MCHFERKYTLRKIRNENRTTPKAQFGVRFPVGTPKKAERQRSFGQFLCNQRVERTEGAFLRVGDKVTVHFKRNRGVAVPHVFADRLYRDILG